MDQMQCCNDNQNATELANFIAAQKILFRETYGRVTLSFVFDGPWDIEDHRKQFLIQATKFFPETANKPLRANNLFYDLLIACCKESDKSEYVGYGDEDDEDDDYL